MIGSISTPAGPVDRIIGLIGSPVLLIPCGRGKSPIGKWADLDVVEAMSDPRHLAALAAGNIGVVLGRKSGGLISVDFDREDLLLEFLRLNQGLGETLVTRGRRGGNVWYRMDSPYPRLQRLKLNGDPVGEWRSDGGQTIVYGEHPEGGWYSMWKEVPPIRIPFEAISWPEGLAAPQDETSDTKGRRVTQNSRIVGMVDSQNSRTLGCVGGGDGGSKDLLLDPNCAALREAVARVVSDAPRQNNDSLFGLARLEKSLANKGKVVCSLRPDANTEILFRIWLSLTPKEHRRHSEEDYWMEFVGKRPYVKTAVDALKPYESAWLETKDVPAPQSLLGLVTRPSRDINRVLSFLWRQSQLTAGGTAICQRHWVANKASEEGADSLMHPIQVDRIVKALVGYGIITVVEKGSPGTKIGKPTIYRFVESPEWVTAMSELYSVKGGSTPTNSRSAVSPPPLRQEQVPECAYAPNC
jgi:hypothetical protein